MYAHTFLRFLITDVVVTPAHFSLCPEVWKSFYCCSCSSHMPFITSNLPHFHSALHIPSGHPYSQIAPSSLQTASIAAAEPSHILFTRRPQSHNTLCSLCCYQCLEILLNLMSLLAMFSALLCSFFWGGIET